MRRRVEGRSYGQRVPPLTSVIKSILERYPDGGQILKEIIKNADDASATTISFLLDSRGSPYGKSSLLNGELAKFQGPALYSFNNALFTKEDWDGLQSLMDSNKKEEPLKVGRFGIGFSWESGQQTVLQLNLEMVIEIFDTATGTRQETWITHNRIGDKKGKMRQRALNLHLLPWVGFAAPLSVAGGKRTGSNGGRIFCFLPLPPDADAKTGYPVHIHGYFGLTDNRRGLKWPGPECQNDDMAEWNVDLMKYVGSQAYASLLQYMITCLPASHDMITIFYQCWPDKQYVNKHWKDIIDEVYNLLLSKNVFWTQADGGQWLSLNEAVLERLRRKPLTKTVVMKVLHLANEPVVSLPLHVDEYVRIKAPGIRIVTPTYLRGILKQNRKGSWEMENMSRAERIAMLQYIVTDKNFADFEGIALLPLADESFTTFKAGKRCGLNDVVYVETPENRMTLLPGIESRCLDPSINCLNGMAVEQNNYRSSQLQLVQLDPQIVISLLRQILPNEMLNLPDPVVWNPSRGNHPSEAWLVEFWKWLCRIFPYNLTELEGFPLIKCFTGQYTALAKLRKDPKVIRQKNSETGISLPYDVISLLKKAGVVVLSEVPYYMMQHSCFSIYVADASPEGVLKVLRNVGSQRIKAAMTASNAQERRSSRDILSSLRRKLSNDETQFLKSLPIFEAIDQTSFIDAQNKSTTAPRRFSSQMSLKIKNASSILSVEDNASNQLLKLISIPEMTMGQFLIREIFPHLSYYTKPEVTSFMCWALRRIDVFRYEDPTFCTYLSSLNFVDAGQGRLAMPKDLFDPRNKLNNCLFEGEELKFPVGEFSRDDILVPLRNHLGLKETLDHVDVAVLAINLQSFNIDLRRRKAMALLEFLGKNSSLLEGNFFVADRRMMLQDYLRDVAWVPCHVDPPRWYPKCMPWKSVGDGLLRPEEAVASQYGVVAGSVMAVLESEPSSLIKNVFGWDKPPDGSIVVEQLINACDSIGAKSLQGFEMEQFWRMLKSIYEVLAVSDISDYYQFLRQADFVWIWNGEGFSSPCKVAFRRQTNFDLKPYLHAIPKEMQEGKLRGFFAKFGVKDCFTEEDLLDVLFDIKTKHDNAKLERDVIVEDKQLALDILHWIVREGPLSPELRDKVYVPVMKGPGILSLVPLKECTFCDVAWLSGNFPELSELSLIDESISTKTASLLGIRDIRFKNLEDMSRSLGQPFGQKELLTDRLANILKTYPCDFGILKELLQNADDAKATEIHFVYDPRQHGKERLFTDSWKELQGPALCVYNNRPFSEKDIEGIQRLGIGSKADSPEKTGQYGIGFNAVYHLTDCPSFITDGNTLCVLDPHARYAPGATKENPGRLIGPFDKTGNFEENYRDVLPGYLGDMFDLKGSTMFRFPLRNKDMASKSDISQEVALSVINHLLKNFKTEAKETLLFLNYVKKISISKIEDDELKLIHEVSADLKEEDEKKRNSLAAHVKTLKHLPTSEIERFQVTYPILLQEKTAEEKLIAEKWIVQQTFGAGKNSSIKIPDGRRNGLLPRAGVAAKVTTWNNFEKEKFEKTTSATTKRKAFCFLPLPVTTGLPLHVNGHFVLDSGRRHLWQDEDGSGFGTKWNNFMKTEVIADAYVSLLLEARKHIPHLEDGLGSGYFNTVHESYLGLEWYQRLFPSKIEAETQWEKVAAAVLFLV